MISELGNHLWQSTLFTGVVALLVWMLRKNRAAVRYGLWLAASLKFLIPLGALAVVGSQIEWPTVRLTAQQLVPPERAAVMTQISEPFGPAIAAPNATSISPSPARLVMSILFGVWLCGFAANCLSWGRTWRRMRVTLSAATPAPIEVQKRDFRIKILCTPGPQEPGVLGIFEPVLLLPEGIAEHLTAPQLQAILTHELCHIRRRDNLAAAVHMVVESLFWFHPAVWWIERQLMEERERACDEEVLAAGIDPQDYCEGIVNVCKLYLTAPLVCVSGVTGGNLRRRLEGIMTHDGTVALNLARKLVLASAGILAVAAPVLFGIQRLANASAQSSGPPQSAVRPITTERQDITGTWQGLLKTANREFRLVFNISLEDNKLTAVMYNIDQGGEGTRASAITRDGSTIKIMIAGIRGNYEGKLASDGKTIAGTWTQEVPQPLNLARVTPQTAWVVPDAPIPAKPMSADAAPAFEVATIKPSRSSGPGVGMKLSPGGLFGTESTSLSQLIKFAYDVHPNQIIGGPSWLRTEKYDVTGKPDKPGRPSLDQLHAMVRKLLADRFQLTFHHDKREMSAYAIRIAKPGPKLIENDSDPSGLPRFRVGPRALGLSNATMEEFASILMASILDRPAVDQTGLGSTRYDFEMKWTPDSSPSQPGGAEPPVDNADAPPDLYTAFQEQLGLKLESTKALVDVLIIDRVEKPSAN